MPVIGLLKPDLTALLKQLNSADTVTLPDLAASDLVKLAQVLQPMELHADVSRSAAFDQSLADSVQARPVIIAARLDAEMKLGQAEQVIELAGGRKLAQWETDPQTLLNIGHRLFSAGGHANYLRAAAVAEMIQSAYWGSTLIQDQTAPTARVSSSKQIGFPVNRILAAVSTVKLRERVRSLWGRAPLLVLLLAWLAVGIFGGTLYSGFGFEFWAVGFLALVGLGFYSTIRR
jgi:hypothetical protein